MQNKHVNPRILIVTPEVTYLPDDMGNVANYLTAKAGGLADVSAALIRALYNQGADVHVAIPDYRTIFRDNYGPLWPLMQKEMELIQKEMPEYRVHLAEDRAFYYLNQVYSNYQIENLKISLAFQREVINYIIRRVQPDLIHCNDWMTGLIPAVARQMKIPCLFTVHNIHTVKSTLAEIEDRGIDAAYFWQHLYYDRMGWEYEEIRNHNPVDFLVSGVFAAHFVNTVSPTFLSEIVDGHHDFVAANLHAELANKANADCAVGILNAPDPSYNPETDADIFHSYGPVTHVSGKAGNKLELQKRLGMIQDKTAPLFFWPHRLDNVQKGCQLLADILYQVISAYWDQNLQVLFVANGTFKVHFTNIVNIHNLSKRVAICDFDEALARQAYAAADFIFMPSRFEPCGLPQMIGPIYGALTVGHNTGGIHDTVTVMDVENNRGNGFLFDVFDSRGLFWAIEQAMLFFSRPQAQRADQITRIMKESLAQFNHDITAQEYIRLYEKMVNRPLVVQSPY